MLFHKKWPYFEPQFWGLIYAQLIFIVSFLWLPGQSKYLGSSILIGPNWIALSNNRCSFTSSDSHKSKAPSLFNRSLVTQGASWKSASIQTDGRPITLAETNPANQFSPATMRSGQPVLLTQSLLNFAAIFVTGQSVRFSFPVTNEPYLFDRPYRQTTIKNKDKKYQRKEFFLTRVQKQEFQATSNRRQWYDPSWRRSLEECIREYHRRCKFSVQLNKVLSKLKLK